jgi:hypothetical protein
MFHLYLSHSSLLLCSFHLAGSQRLYNAAAHQLIESTFQICSATWMQGLSRPPFIPPVLLSLMSFPRNMNGVNSCHFEPQERCKTTLQVQNAQQNRNSRNCCCVESVADALMAHPTANVFPWYLKAQTLAGLH